jgi:hypothetical protein
MSSKGEVDVERKQSLSPLKDSPARESVSSGRSPTYSAFEGTREGDDHSSPTVSTNISSVCLSEFIDLVSLDGTGTISFTWER